MADSSSSFADLNGKVVVVFGGAGFVGGAIVLDLLAKGSTVAVASRTPESLEKLRQWTQEELTKLGKTGSGKLLTFNSDVSTEAGAQAFIKEVKSHEATGGRIDHAVSSLGSWAIDGPILEVSLERFHQQVDNYATSHFIALKALLPLIADQEGSSFTIVTGGAGDRLLVPGAGLVTVGASALFGLSNVVRTEYKERPVRVNEYRISVFVKRQDNDDGLQPWEANYKKIGAIGAGIVAHKTLRSEVVRVGPDTISSVLQAYVR